MLILLILLAVILQSESFNVLIISSPHTIPNISDALTYQIYMSKFEQTNFQPIPLYLENQDFQLTEIEAKIRVLNIQVIFDISFNELYTQRISQLSKLCLCFVAYRSDKQFQGQNVYWIMPSYQQEGVALQTLFHLLNLKKVSYLSQQEKRFYKPSEYFDQSKIRISTSVNIPLNSYFGLNQKQCQNNKTQSKLLKEFPKGIRIYGSSTILMQADVC